MNFIEMLGLLRGNITFKVCTISSPNLRPIFSVVLVGFLRSIEISTGNTDLNLEPKTMDWEVIMMDPRLLGLRPFDCQILSMLVCGYTPQSMSEELHFSRAYIYFLMRELRLRFCAHSTRALMSCVIAEGIIQPDGMIADKVMIDMYSQGRDLNNRRDSLEI